MDRSTVLDYKEGASEGLQLVPHIMRTMQVLLLIIELAYEQIIHKRL